MQTRNNRKIKDFNDVLKIHFNASTISAASPIAPQCQREWINFIFI